MRKIFCFILMLVMMTALNVFAQTNLLNEGFEGDAFPPAGWTTNSSSEWVLDDYLVHGGSQAAYVEYNSDGHNSYLITPQLTLDGNYVLHFYYGCDLSYYVSYTTFTVEVSTTGTNTSDFTVLQTMSFDLDDEEYEEAEIDLSAYNGQTIYIAFHVLDDDGTGVFMDDVTLEPTLPCAKPSAFTASIVSTTEVGLSWNGNADTYNVEYGEAGFTLGDGTPVTVSGETSVTIDDLTEGVTYDYYVQADCGGDGTSIWIGPVTLNTSQYNMPVSGSDTVTTCGLVVYDNGGPNGDYSADCNSILVIYPENEDAVVALSGTNSSESRYSGGCYDALEIYDGVGTDGQLLVSSCGTNQTVNVISSTGPLTIQFSSDYSSQESGFELTVSCVTCFAPHSIMANDITTTSANLTWVGADENGDYQVTVIGPSDTTVYEVNGQTLDLSDLTPSSFYTLFIQTVCEDGSLSLPSTNYAFNTGCDLIDITEDTPWTENFEGYSGGGEHPFVCWATPVTDATYHGPFVYGGHYPSCHSGSNSAEFKGANNMVVLPEFSNDIHSLRLSFWATTTQSNTTATVVVGVVTNAMDTSTFEPVAMATNPGQRGPDSANGSHTDGWGNYMGPFDFSGVEAESGRIAIRYTNTSSPSSSWNLDDFTVSLIPDCAAPVANSLTATNVVGHSATISWTDNDVSHTNWMVYYKPTSAGDDEWQSLSANDTTVELTELTPETDYQVYVVTVCAGAEGTDATLTISFRTDVACPAPSEFAIENITAENATISWLGGSQSYTVEYGITGFTPGTGSFTELTESSIDLTDLEGSTSYTLYVYGDCGAEDGLSDTSMFTFTTPCVSVVVADDAPFTENFNTLTAGIPLCWDNSEGTTTTESYKWNYYATGATGSCMRFNSYLNPNGRTNMLKTPILDLSALSTPMVSFSYKNPAGGDFSVYLSTDGGTTYPTVLATGLTAVTAWTEAEYVLPEMDEAENVVIVFKGTSNYDYGDAYIYLDDVFVGEAPTCPKPTGLAVMAVTSSSVTLSWTPGDEESAWEIVYGAPGFNPNAEDAEPVSADDTLFEVIGLNPSTLYEFYVRANCSDGNSLWSNNSVTVATSCVTTLVTTDEPFEEDFNTLTAGIPTCWDNSEGTTTSESYKWNYYVSGATGACVRFDSYYNYTGNTNMLKTPVLDLTGLSTPMLSFSYKNPAGGDFSVYLSTDGGATYPTVLATGLTGVTAWTEAEYVLPEMDESENVVIVFKGTSNYEYGDAYIYLDDVFVGEAPACPKPNNLSVTGSTETTVTLSWTAGNEETEWSIVYGSTGFDPETEGQTIGNVNTTTYEVTGLTAGAAYDFYVMANCTDEMSGLTGPVTANPGSITLPTSGEITITSCGMTLYDDGGQDGDYSTNCDVTVVVNPDQPGMMVHITGTFDVEEEYDYLLIYDGPDTDGELLFDSDNDYVLDVTSTTGPLTIYFYSDYMDNYNGFELHVTCVEGGDTIPEPSCNAPANVTASNITYNSADIDWTQDGTPDSWTISYKKGSVETWTTVNVNSHPYTITDLESETSYSVKVTANCGENSQTSNTIPFVTLPNGVNEYVNSTVLYPNPTTGQFTILNEQCTIENVEVYDVYGKVLNSVMVNDNKAVLDVTGYASGIYFARIHTDKGVVVKQIVKK